MRHLITAALKELLLPRFPCPSFVHVVFKSRAEQSRLDFMALTQGIELKRVRKEGISLSRLGRSKEACFRLCYVMVR